MSGIIYVRDVDDEVIETLKRRAAEARMSLSAYIAEQLSTVAARPTNAEILRRARRRAARRAGTGPATAEIVQTVRAGRDRDIPGDWE